jgi:hypothetical protein
MSNASYPNALPVQAVMLIPEQLYGREREIETLLACFDRVVAHGTPELVLVSGFSGIGKSSVVHELHKVLVRPRGLYASGKFDQYKRDIPYVTVAQAFQSLVRSLLSQGEVELGRWRDSFSEALGSNGQLIVNLVPELELIIGKQNVMRDEAFEREHLDAQEVRRRQTLPVSLQKCRPPGVRVALRSRVDSVPLEDVGDGATPDLMSQISQCPSDPSVTPGRILERHPQNKIHDRLLGARPTWAASMTVVPFTRHQLPVPPQQRVRRHQSFELAQHFASE